MQRIKRVLDYYYKMGANKESVNRVYHKIIYNKKNKIKNIISKEL